MSATTHHRVVIIGSGPAGLTAALYTARANLSPLIIAGNQPGGQLMGTSRVENWPGIEAIDGPGLIKQLTDHATTYGATLRAVNVTAVDITKKPFTLQLSDATTCTADSIIIACGATARRLNCPGEAEYWGKGVSTCATCDAPFYKDRPVVIVGGGNSAVTYALQLARHGARVTIVHLLDKLTATDPTVAQVYDHPLISIIYQHTVTEITGNGTNVTGVVITDQQAGTQKTIETAGVFIAIGMGPNTALFADQLECTKGGYIARPHGGTKTSVPGVFAAGDVADQWYHQAITAAGEGCQAALDCEYYLTGSVQITYPTSLT